MRRAADDDAPEPADDDAPEPADDVGGKVADRNGRESSPPFAERRPTGKAGKVPDRSGPESAPHTWTELAALMRRQDGVVSIEQTRALGLSDRQLGRAVAQGRLVRRHRGVYADALQRPTPRSHLIAALRAVGPEAFLSRRTGLALAGVRALDLRAIELTIVAQHTPRHAGLIVHRTSVAPLAGEIRVRDGLRVASPMLALVEVAGRETDAELDRLIAELCRRRALDLERIDAVTRRRAGLRGAARLRAALRRYRPGDAHRDASGLERDVARWLGEPADIPSPQRNVRLDGGRWEVDFRWPRERVVLEVDGAAYHRTPAELERDRLKDAWLQTHGDRVLRVTEFRWAHDREGILADLRALLAAGQPQSAET